MSHLLSQEMAAQPLPLAPPQITLEWVWQQATCPDPKAPLEQPQAWWVLLTLPTCPGSLFCLLAVSVPSLNPGKGTKPLPLGPG